MVDGRGRVIAMGLEMYGCVVVGEREQVWVGMMVDGQGYGTVWRQGVTEKGRVGEGAERGWKDGKCWDLRGEKGSGKRTGKV